VPRHTQQPKSTKTEPKSEPSIPRLTLVWTRCLEYVKNKNFEEAYRVMLEHGDDMYLLRLVAQTRPVVQHLEPKTAEVVISRINRILRNAVFPNIEIEWI